MKLIDLCNEGITRLDWLPHDGETFCNEAANFVAQGMGCTTFAEDGKALLADIIIGRIKNNPDWRVVTLGGTWILANQGALVFGMLSSSDLEEPHGHISTVYPGSPVWSGHWESMSPLAFNIGKDNFIGKSMSYAFRTMPEFYGWIPSMPKETP